MNNRGPQQRRPYDPWDPPSPPSDEYEDYTNPMGGWGWDGTEQMPEIVEAVLDGDLDEVKVMIRDVKNNSRVPDKSLRLLVNASQHLREVVRKEAVGVEAPIEGRKGDGYIDYHGMTALAFAAKLGQFDMVKYLLANFADPTLKGRCVNGQLVDAFEAAALCEDEKNSTRIKELLEEARPFWKAASYSGADYSQDRVNMAFPNEPTDFGGLLRTLSTFPE